MKRWKKLVAILLAAALPLALAGCKVPGSGFADYDVSGYVKALLDNSYYGDGDDLVRISGISREEALDSHLTTMENAAVRFCNAYGVAPDETQLAQLRSAMAEIYAKARYTVKDERKVEDGYYLEVEVAPIENFVGRGADVEKLKADAEAEALSDPLADANQLFVAKVIDFCLKEGDNLAYAPDTRTIALDVRQTDQGELQLNMDQIDTIDMTVVRLAR